MTSSANDTDHQGRRAAAAAKLTDTRDHAVDAARRAKSGIESSPFGLLAGGLALGIVAGVALPRSEREKEALDALGQRLAEGAFAAAAAAKQTGKEQISAALFSREDARKGVSKVVSSAMNAAKDPSAAA